MVVKDPTSLIGVNPPPEFAAVAIIAPLDEMAPLICNVLFPEVVEFKVTPPEPIVVIAAVVNVPPVKLTLLDPPALAVIDPVDSAVVPVNVIAELAPAVIAPVVKLLLFNVMEPAFALGNDTVPLNKLALPRFIVEVPALRLAVPAVIMPAD